MRPRAREARARASSRAAKTRDLARRRREFPGIDHWVIRDRTGMWAADWTGSHWKTGWLW